MSDPEYNEITEGLAKLLFPKSEKVFYNPIQQFNRDISVLSIIAWSERYLSASERSKNKKHSTKKHASEKPEAPKLQQELKPFINIIEGLAASGLRSCRYALEIPLVKSVIANDLSKEAVKSIERNAEHNGVQSIIEARKGDANFVMWENMAKTVHVIDLDPYGSAVPFLDSSIRAISDDGLLLVTCTDMGVLAGNGYPEKCFSAYGGTTVRNDATHESALRLVLNTISTTAARYGRVIEPLLSLSVDYYIRVFVQVHTQPALVKRAFDKSMLVYNCTGCQTTSLQPLGKVTQLDEHKFKFGYAKGPPVGTNCSHCQSPHHVSGPMWAGKLHNQEFVQAMVEGAEKLDPDVYKTSSKIKGMLSLVAQELETPFYVSPSNMCSKVRAPVPALKVFTSAVFNGGYDLSLTHAQPGCIKTNAPYEFLWDVIREWAKTNKTSTVTKENPGTNILRGEQKHEISFETHPKAVAMEAVRRSRLARYPLNPQAEWGPMAKPSKRKRAAEQDEEPVGSGLQD